MNRLWSAVPAVFCALVLATCHHSSQGSPDDGDSGADTDVDSDSDTDSQTGSDTETGTDTWTEFEADCYAETINGLEVNWCRIPEGTFRMGCDPEGPNGSYCQEDDHTLHDVTVSEFEMLDREVSVEMYRACIEAGPCDDAAHFEVWDSDLGQNDSWGSCRMDRDPTYEYPAGYDDHPMDCVDWHGLTAFCEWIGARLPTEAEWERAARGDHDGLNGDYWATTYSEEILEDDGPCSHANFLYLDGDPCDLDDTAPVASLIHTSFGLFDMTGNLAEWASDWWGADYYSQSEAVDPQGPTEGEYHIVRGGSWIHWGGEAYSGWMVMMTGRRDKLPPTLNGMENLPFEMELVYGFTAKIRVGGRCARSAD